MTDDRRAPVQAEPGPPPRRRPRGTISWAEHLEVFEGYRARFPGSARDQPPEKIAERGGWGYYEAEGYLGRPLETWAPRD